MKNFNQHRDGMMVAAHNHDFGAFNKAWTETIADKAITDTEFEHLYDMHSELAAVFRR